PTCSPRSVNAWRKTASAATCPTASPRFSTRRRNGSSGFQPTTDPIPLPVGLWYAPSRGSLHGEGTFDGNGSTGSDADAPVGGRHPVAAMEWVWRLRLHDEPRRGSRVLRDDGPRCGGA